MNISNQTGDDKHFGIILGLEPMRYQGKFDDKMIHKILTQSASLIPDLEREILKDSICQLTSECKHLANLCFRIYFSSLKVVEVLHGNGENELVLTVRKDGVVDRCWKSVKLVNEYRGVCDHKMIRKILLDLRHLLRDSDIEGLNKLIPQIHKRYRENTLVRIYFHDVDIPPVEITNGKTSNELLICIDKDGNLTYDLISQTVKNDWSGYHYDY